MKRPTLQRWLAMLILIFALPSLACQFSLIDWSLFGQPTPVPGSGPTPTPTPLVEVTFKLILPSQLQAGETLYLAVLDEVTGLSLNALLYKMEPLDAQTYALKMPVPLGSVLKYRYVRKGTATVQEDTTFGELVRYRIHHASGPGEVLDVVASWSDQAYSGPRGRIRGTITNASNGQPLVNILVSAGGVSTLTDSLGQYSLEGLVPGTHILSAHALDGSFRPYQQGASVGVDSTTPAPISLQSARLVQVTFNVTAPSDTVVGAPLRMAGNLLQLGNTFGDLRGGVSLAASRMPVLTAGATAGSYSISLKLPAGADIRYKYTLGDGFWNGEHDAEGKFVVRQFIVPERDTVVNDVIYTWQSGTSAPIQFNVTVPANTPPGDTISIQFNPYGWTEPIPMWPLGNNRWVYRLYSPLNMLGSFGYRYCRNDQCGIADDIDTSGGQSRNVSTSLTPETRQDTVRAWKWLPETDPSTVVAVPIRTRTAGFWAGIEFESGYHPSWQALYPSAFNSVKNLGANIQVLTPTWTAKYASPLVFAPTAGQDPLWADGLQAIQHARAVNLNVALYPTPRLLPSGPDFWLMAPRNPGWWEDWFASYRAFALYHADLATQGGAQALILGGDAVAPALPNGLLPNGAPSGVPSDADARWRNLVSEVRSRFKGQLLWAQPYRRDGLAPLPAFANQFDAIYLLWSAPLSANGLGTDAMSAEAGRRLDTDILPALSPIGKPVIIAIDYPSAGGAASGCIAQGGGCLEWTSFSPVYPDNGAVAIDLQGQANLYQAMFLAIESRSWVSGFVSRGYFSPVALIDKSSSVRNKPAADLIWYWYPRLQGR